MKFNLYTVELGEHSNNLVDALQQINEAEISSREIAVGGKLIRLESVHIQELGKDTLCIATFALKRDKGPGNYKQNELIVDLDVDLGFGEETTVLISKHHDFMVAQYNHHGTKAGHIKGYLNDYLLDRRVVCDIFPNIDSSVIEKLNKSKSQSTIHVKMNCAVLPSETDLTLIESLRHVGGAHNAGKIEIVLSYGENKRGGPLSIGIDSIKEILRMQRASEGQLLDKFTVKTQNDDDLPSELLDLLHHTRSEEIDDGHIGMTEGRRYNKNDIQKFLIQFYSQWLPLFTK